MRVQLKCMHVLNIIAKDPPDTIRCPGCHNVRSIVAIELREWHVSCMDCSYGRWFGADSPAANRAAGAHRHSKTTVHLAIPDRSRLWLKRNYARNVKGFILGHLAEHVFQDLVTEDDQDEIPF